MNVRFLYVEKARLDEVQLQDGQIIALTDESGYYYDMGGQRYLVAAGDMGNASGIPYGTVSNSSTATSLVSNIESIDLEHLTDGTCAYIINTAGRNFSGSAITLNISNTGARPVFDAKSGSRTVSYSANSGALFIYNTDPSRSASGCWDMVTDKLVTNSSLGNIQLECSDTATPASYYSAGAEFVRGYDFQLTDNALLSVKFNIDVVAGKQLKVADSDPYPMVYCGAQLEDGVITAGSTALFRYVQADNVYVLLSVDSLIGDVRQLQETAYSNGIFWCQYGVTPYPDIAQAINTKTACLLYYQDLIYQCIGFTSRSTIGFEFVLPGSEPQLHSVQCSAVQGWSTVVQTGLATKAQLDEKYTKPEDGIPLSDCDFDPAVVDPSFQNEGEAAETVITGKRFNQLETVVKQDLYTVIHNDTITLSNNYTFIADTGRADVITIPTTTYVSNSVQYYENRLFVLGSADYEWSIWSYNFSGVGAPGLHPAMMPGWINASCPLLLEYNATSDIYYRIAIRRVDGATFDTTERDWIRDTLSIRSYGGSDAPSSGSAIRTTRNNVELVKQLMDVATTYFNNRDELEYKQNFTTILDESSRTNHIDCSAFIGLLLRGLRYGDTSYGNAALVGTDPMDWKASSKYTWARNLQYYQNVIGGTGESMPPEYYQTPQPLRTASQIGEWMIGMGWQVPIDEKLSNLEVGDILFYAKKKYDDNTGTYVWREPDRFMRISHVAVCMDKAHSDTANLPDWVTYYYPNWYSEGRYNDYPVCHRIMHATSETPPIVRSLVECNYDGVMYPTYNGSGSSNVYTHTGVPTLCLVCRPDLGALSWDATAGVATTNATGTPGQIKYDNNTLYICVDWNTWKAISLRTIS